MPHMQPPSLMIGLTSAQQAPEHGNSMMSSGWIGEQVVGMPFFNGGGAVAATGTGPGSPAWAAVAANRSCRTIPIAGSISCSAGLRDFPLRLGYQAFHRPCRLQ